MPARINGFSLAYTTAGAVVLWSGIKGESISDTFKGILSGQAPSQNQEPISSATAPAGSSSSGSSNSGGSSSGSSSSGFATPSGSGSSSSGMAALQEAAKPYGWDTGAEWTALTYVEMREAGFSATAVNPTSGALGMAQALGHGNANTAGTLGNQYGGYGLTDAQAQQANSGNAYWQAVWMVNYIKATYGDPIAAANHEREYNWY